MPQTHRSLTDVSGYENPLNHDAPWLYGDKIPPHPRKKAKLGFVEQFHGGKFLTFKHGQAGTAARADVGNLVRKT